MRSAKVDTFLLNFCLSRAFLLSSREGERPPCMFPRCLPRDRDLRSADREFGLVNLPSELGGRVLPRELGLDPSRELGRALPRELGRALPRELGRTLPRELGRALPRELGRALPRELGRALPRELGRALPRELGRDM